MVRKIHEHGARKIRPSRHRLEHGALDYRECVGDDVPMGKLTSFPRSVKMKRNEVVIFSWVTYKSRKHRDAVMAKVMTDPRLTPMMKPGAVPFDGKRMIFGGFKTIVSASGK